MSRAIFAKVSWRIGPSEGGRLRVISDKDSSRLFHIVEAKPKKLTHFVRQGKPFEWSVLNIIDIPRLTSEQLGKMIAERIQLAAASLPDSLLKGILLADMSWRRQDYSKGILKVNGDNPDTFLVE